MGAARRGASRPRAGSISPEKERRILLQEISPPSASVWTMYFHFERQRIKIDWFHHFYRTQSFFCWLYTACLPALALLE